MKQSHKLRWLHFTVILRYEWFKSIVFVDFIDYKGNAEVNQQHFHIWVCSDQPALRCLVYSLPENISTLKAFQRAAVCDYSPPSNVLPVSVSWLASVLWQWGTITDSLFWLSGPIIYSAENGSGGSTAAPSALFALMMTVFVVFCARRYHKSQAIYLESKDNTKISCVISSVGTNEVTFPLIWSSDPVYSFMSHWIHADTAHTSVCMCSGEMPSGVLNV